MSASKKLAEHAKIILSQQSPVKNQLVKNVKQITADIEKVYYLLTEDMTDYGYEDLEKENEKLHEEILYMKERECNVTQYREMLEKMKTQTSSLREKLSSLEAGGHFKEKIRE